METVELKFTIAGGKKILIPLNSPREGMVFIELINPWSNEQFSVLVEGDQLDKDIMLLLPKRGNTLEDAMLISLHSRILTHADEFGLITDADCCTYMNYFFILRKGFEKEFDLEPMGSDATVSFMLGFVDFLIEAGVEIEQTVFSKYTN